MLLPACMWAAACSWLISTHGPTRAGSFPSAHTGLKQPTTMMVRLSGSRVETRKRLLPVGQTSSRHSSRRFACFLGI